MAIENPQYDNDRFNFDVLDESQPAATIIFGEIFDTIIITSNGQIKYWNGTAYVAKPIKYWDGAAWVTKPIKHWNGTGWVGTNF